MTVASDNGDTEWEGYADYQAVSGAVARSVSDAVDAYAWLQRKDQEGGSLDPAQVAEETADILGAALTLYVEMQEEHEQGNEEYDAILDRWGYDVGEGGVAAILEDVAAGELDPDEARGRVQRAVHTGVSDGYIEEFRRTDFYEEMPDWTQQFVIDIRRAGWKLGYLQAGRRSRKPPEDRAQAEAEHMLRGGES